jgi:predicted O-linked N-acetylglucosamine transferase (SPINDLY family)
VSDDPATREHLRQEAQLRQLDTERIVFAGRLPYPQHLARLKLADLFLDTLPYNAGATASDCLWMGVPLLTCVGEAYASRMGGSLLRVMGLTELITDNLEDYERRAIELLSEPERLRDLRTRLVRERQNSPLFDTVRFCRHLEAAYRTMWQRAERGEGPESFTVDSLPPADVS